jgi:hypothetical protein
MSEEEDDKDKKKEKTKDKESKGANYLSGFFFDPNNG